MLLVQNGKQRFLANKKKPTFASRRWASSYPLNSPLPLKIWGFGLPSVYAKPVDACKFIELDIFNGDKAREAIHVDYGWFVDIQGARPISYEIANACHDIGVPCGYLGEHSASGTFSSVRPFLPGVSG